MIAHLLSKYYGCDEREGQVYKTRFLTPGKREVEDWQK